MNRVFSTDYGNEVKTLLGWALLHLFYTICAPFSTPISSESSKRQIIGNARHRCRTETPLLPIPHFGAVSPALMLTGGSLKYPITESRKLIEKRKAQSFLSKNPQRGCRQCQLLFLSFLPSSDPIWPFDRPMQWRPCHSLPVFFFFFLHPILLLGAHERYPNRCMRRSPSRPSRA